MFYTIVIPTMWKSDLLDLALKEYAKSLWVNEIILIDNDHNLINQKKIKNKKIKVISKKENLFVNPSWNIGHELSTNDNIIFINDDIFISNISKLIKIIDKSNFDLIGLDLQNSNKYEEIKITEVSNNTKRPYGFGCCFFIKKEKFKKIPNEIKIWYGDDIQYYSISNKAMFSIPELQFEMSKTVNSIDGLFSIVDSNDKPKYLQFCKENNIEIII
jgi:hypothetical protein